MEDDKKTNLTKYFENDPPSLFDSIGVAKQSGGPFSQELLQEEAVKPNVPFEVIDFWEPPDTASSGVPPSLTLPGIWTSTDYQDYIEEVSVALLGPDSVICRKEILSEHDVTQDDRGLRQLIAVGCFRAALNLTSRLLSVYGQGYNKLGQVSKNTPHSLGLWFARLSLMLRLGQHEICMREAEAFGKLDRPDVFYEHYPDLYSGRKGSMACFSFRLLIAELPIYKGNLSAAMNSLTDLLEVCKRIAEKFEKESPEAGLFWTKRVNRVIHSVVNCALLMKNYGLTTSLLEGLIEQNSEEKTALKLALARVYLQCGDIVTAEKQINEVFGKDQHEKSLSECINRGLLFMARADYNEALEVLSEGLKIDPENVLLHNNAAVCLLYLGRLKEAIKQFEKAIEVNPSKALNENLILNLATLYELESNNARNKKLNLLKKIAMYKPDLNCSVDLCLKVDYKKPEEVKVADSKETYVV